MRIVVAVDADLLVSADPELWLAGQREAIRQAVAGMGALLDSSHQVALVHGNAPQVGAALLRAELARQDADPLPLDIANSDTQGATGYLFQQAMRNWLHHQQREREITTVITQVLVDVTDPAFRNPTRGVGPYYDQDKARRYAITRSWGFICEPGRGYRRAVPSLVPAGIIELPAIRTLLEAGSVVICAGGGGVPVYRDNWGDLVSANALVDKVDTASLLAAEIGAQVLIFVMNRELIERELNLILDGRQHCFSTGWLDPFIDGTGSLNKDVYNKLIAGRMFLGRGGQEIWLVPPDGLQHSLEEFSGIRIGSSLNGQY